MLGNYDLASFNKVLSNFDLFWEVFACCWHAAILFKMLVIPYSWNMMSLLLEVPHTPPKRNTFFWAVQLEWRYRICPKNWIWTITFKISLLYRYSHWGLFFVFLVRIDASPVICGRPVGHPCTTSPSLGQTGICAMRPPRPAYGIYALCSLHFAAYFMQPFFKTTIIFTFASQIFWLVCM